MRAEVPWSGPLDPGSPRRVHITNVGGAGMSAIATVLAQMGHQVSGNDGNETPFLNPIRALGVAVTVGERSPGVDAADVVVTSTATSPDHADVVAALAAGVPVVHRADALTAICAPHHVMAVAGTHGKSTTSGMLATIMAQTVSGSSYLVGTKILGLGANAAWTPGTHFVIEADESDGTFLRLNAHDAIVTNLESDHLSYWGTTEALVVGFETFVQALSGAAVICIDDPGSAPLVYHATYPVTYGVAADAHHRISDIAAEGLGVAYTHHVDGQSRRVVVPFAPGAHNARNAAGAIALAMATGVGLDAAADALASFAGVARRFELRGEVDGVTFIDSYDHLPTEVAAALGAAASGPFSRVVCVFQPHRFTRTRDLAHTFADAFVDADVLAVTELYPAGEAPIAGVSGQLVVDAVRAAHPGRDVAFLPDLDTATTWLDDTLQAGDCCLTLNAGDLTHVPDVVMDLRRARHAAGASE